MSPDEQIRRDTPTWRDRDAGIAESRSAEAHCGAGSARHSELCLAAARRGRGCCRRHRRSVTTSIKESSNHSSEHEALGSCGAANHTPPQ